MSNIQKKTHESILFLCTTPLQVKICLKLIELKKINNFDVLYCTNQSSGTIDNYYKKIKYISKNHMFLHIKNNKDLLKANFLLPAPFSKKNNYTNIYIASIDNLTFKHILNKNSKADLYTYDDGTANIFKNSEYFKPEKIRKLLIYLKLFNLPNKFEILKKIKYHYTIFKDFDNIVPNENLNIISIFNNTEKIFNNKKISFFIGQPFHEYLDEKKILSLKKYLESKKIDYYVMHPREKKPILDNIKILDKENEIAEVAIIKKSQDKKPLIISAFSTVLFTINKEIADKIYLSIDQTEEEENRLKLIKKTGSKIIKI